MTFPKIYLGKLSQFFLVISVDYCCCHHFSTKVILVKLKILNILMQWLKWFIFPNMFLYCKIIISFSELLPATSFLCILQTHFTRRNTSIPTKLKKCQRITFMMTSPNDGKSDICLFFIKTYSILSVQCKISCKIDKNFLRYMFFQLPPQPWVFLRNILRKYLSKI